MSHLLSKFSVRVFISWLCNLSSFNACGQCATDWWFYGREHSKQTVYRVPPSKLLHATNCNSNSHSWLQNVSQPWEQKEIVIIKSTSLDLSGGRALISSLHHQCHSPQAMILFFFWKFALSNLDVVHSEILVPRKFFIVWITVPSKMESNNSHCEYFKFWLNIYVQVFSYLSRSLW